MGGCWLGSRIYCWMRVFRLFGRLQYSSISLSLFLMGRLHGMVNSPLRWLTVTFSFPGNSAICIPNRARSSFCAPSKTALNCLDPCSPNTLVLISVRRTTCREYSLASARRTSFFTITSRLLGALVPSSSSSSSGSGLAGVEFASACVFFVCRRRREEEGTAGEETASSGSGSCFVH